MFEWRMSPKVHENVLSMALTNIALQRSDRIQMESAVARETLFSDGQSSVGMAMEPYEAGVSVS